MQNLSYSLLNKFPRCKLAHSNPSLQCENIPTMFNTYLPIYSFLISLFTYLSVIQSVPIDPANNNEIVKKNESYDLSHFDEVYDQRQNGSENYRVNVNKVVLVWTPPGSLLTAAMLLEPGLWESDYSDLDDFFNPNSPQKPEVVITDNKPETTKPPNPTSSEENSVSGATITQGSSTKRKLRVPGLSGFIRPFLRRQQAIQN